MADSQDGPGPGADDPSATGDSPDWGRILDAAGFIAGVLLLVIIGDIWTDGRLISRHLHPRGKDEPGDSPE